ncbi:MAG: flagellar basal body P-ring formation chaperone FlgA [Candidatus Accumulibacter sp. UW26]|jgi:flagella basal body P-ring formation protein FlgA
MSNSLPHAARISLLLLAVACCGAYSETSETPLASALDQYLQQQTRGLPGKVSFRIGSLDRHARFAPCSAFEPFLPPASRLRGKTTLGVRCLGPAAWTAYVSVEIRIFGSYLVTARPLVAGQIVGSADLLVREGDLGVLPTSILTDPDQAIGMQVRSGMAAGLPLRSELLSAPWAVQQGQSVRLLTSGAGFTISNEGKALNNAGEGQLVRVRTASGQVVSGVARRGGVVEVSY